MRKQIAAYTATGTKVINRVEKEEELEPVPAFSAEVEVELSRDDPTLGSSALAFYHPRVSYPIGYSAQKRRGTPDVQDPSPAARSDDSESKIPY